MIRSPHTKAFAAKTTRPTTTLSTLATACALSLAALTLSTPAQAQSQGQGQTPPTSGAATTRLDRVEIIGTSPLSGQGLRKNQIAAPVQTATDEDLDNAAALDLSDYMNRRMGSVHVNNMQGNPLQMDVNYRGYTASPLLGTPQGLSVYMDGVRLNQPFGDVVSWDLIPKAAIANISLMPGSNPLFGLNTLGGALSIQTKDGRSHPGGAVQTRITSLGQMTGEVSYGSSDTKGWDVFGTLSGLGDTGWRVNSPSSVVQGFVKLGWTDGPTRATVSVSGADSALNGNGLQEQRMLTKDWASVYTKPDITQQQSLLINATLDHALNASTKITGNAFVRKISGTTFNADINEGSLDQAVYQPSAADIAALKAAGYTGYPTSGATAKNTPFPYWRCIAQALQRDEPGEKCNGLLNSTSNVQTSVGANAQASMSGELAGHRNLFMVGAGIELNRVRFTQGTQLGYLNADRSVTGVNAFADGVNGGDVDGAPYDTAVSLHAKTHTESLFFSNTTSFGTTWNLTASGRYNRTTITNRDQRVSAPDPTSLDGDHRFSRFNPAVGITWNPNRVFNAYAGYAQSSRAPTAIELGCANPDQPCKLPNAMAGDPPLRQVVTQTFEAGVRGALDGGLSWRLGAFRADNKDDILFVADNQSGYGYFKNFGKTRRQGIEAGIEHRSDIVTLGLNYTLLDATYQSAEVLGGAGNSSNDTGGGLDGNITIQCGNKIPLVPRHILKASAGWQLNPQWAVELDMIGVSGVFARGNENNQHQPDGIHYLGEGRTSGYAVFNLGSSYQPTSALRYFAQVNNLFDRRYATGAQLGATGFDASGNFIARPYGPSNNASLNYATFYAPGAPRSVTVGMRYEFDR